MIFRRETADEASATGDDGAGIAAGGALQGPLFASLLARLSRPRPELAGGTRIGPYRIASTLGQGGMAVVYLAERIDGGFEQRVALKLLPPGDGSDAVAARELLRRERQILARLEHPHIARLLDGGSTDAGTLWFALEVVQGERIDRWCERRDAARAQRLALFLQVCDAVQFAHAHLLVHRDLKPSNILVNDAGQAKLLDFGVAVMAQARDGSAPRAITPGYASPEQRRGEPETIASDIWQLGRLLGLLCQPGAGRRDADLRMIVARATHDEPARRYETVTALAADLRRMLGGHPIAARSGSALHRFSRFVVRHRWASAIAALATLLILVLGATFASRLARERAAATREAQRANATVAFLSDMFRSNDPAASRGAAPDVRDVLARNVERLRADLAHEPEVQARLLLTIAQIYDSLGDAATALERLEEAAGLARRAHAMDDAMRAQIELARARMVLNHGRPLDALALLSALEANIDFDRAANARAALGHLALRAMAELGSGDPGKAKATADRALALAVALDGADAVEAANRRHDLGIILRVQRKFPEAVAAFDGAARVYRARLGADHPRYAGALKSLGGALIDAGDLARADVVLAESIERIRLLYGGGGRNYAAALRSLGQLRAAQGRAAEGIPMLDEALALFETSLGARSTEVAHTLQTLGDAHARNGDAAAALAAFERGLEIRRALLPADHHDIASSHYAIAVQHWRLGEAAAAQAAADASWRVRVRRHGESDPATLRALVLRGVAAQLGGRESEAQQIFGEARRLALAAGHADEIETLIRAPAAVLGAPYDARQRASRQADTTPVTD